ncbi:MAG: hypothetical protein ACE5F6_12175 [Anaerolineae bacterium]
MVDSPNVPLSLLRDMLYAGSEDNLNQIVAQHPELMEYHQFAFPLHEALGKLMIVTKSEAETACVEMVQEMSPGVSVVITWSPEGKRIANVYQAPADVLSRMIVRMLQEGHPSARVLDVCNTLQVALHHPDYLTEQSYWMLQVMTRNEEKDRVVKVLRRLHEAMEICLEEGLDSRWIRTFTGAV